MYQIGVNKNDNHTTTEENRTQRITETTIRNDDPKRRRKPPDTAIRIRLTDRDTPTQSTIEAGDDAIARKQEHIRASGRRKALR
ncbi:hypothetical protein U1Q18_021944 [Sarracenia purpurea var. burkii]